MICLNFLFNDTHQIMGEFFKGSSALSLTCFLLII